MMRRVAGYVLRTQWRLRWQLRAGRLTNPASPPSSSRSSRCRSCCCCSASSPSACSTSPTSPGERRLAGLARHPHRPDSAGQGAYSGMATAEDRKKAFKQALCAKAPTYIDCNKVVVLVQSNSGGFGGITQPACATDGTMIDQSTAEFNPGGASSVVLITVCYPWEFGGRAAVHPLEQPEGRLAAHPGIGRFPHGTLPDQLRHAPRISRQTRELPCHASSASTLALPDPSSFARRYRKRQAGRRRCRVRVHRADHVRHVRRRRRAQPGHHRRPPRHAGRELRRRPGCAQGEVDHANRDRRHHEDRRIHHGPLQSGPAAGDRAQRQLLVHQRHQHQAILAVHILGCRHEPDAGLRVHERDLHSARRPGHHQPTASWWRR